MILYFVCILVLVVQSIPHLDSLRQLEMQLVQSNDLKKFVISIRHAFKAQTKLS